MKMLIYEYHHQIQNVFIRESFGSWDKTEVYRRHRALLLFRGTSSRYYEHQPCRGYLSTGVDLGVSSLWLQK